jgi:PKD repeat protein
MGMTAKSRLARFLLLLSALTLSAVLSACNLSASPGGIEELTPEMTTGALATRTPAGTTGAPTRLPLTALVPTQRPGTFPTSVVNLPPTNPPSQPPGQQVPVSIVILSPIPGNVVAGNIQVLGSAMHPQFLQYQLEYGPDPNPGNLWYAATGPIQQPVMNNLLGIWNTGTVQDGTYQLRLRVFLRDATSLSTVVNNIRIQNRVPTQVPSATPNIARPIAAFTVDKNQGQAPLNVRFTNQSNGSINSYQWNFGDGSTSTEQNPSHGFSTPGLYNVTLTVSGPGGSSNVSTQINVQSQNPPVAGFTADKFSGPAPLTVQFTDTSAGTVTSYHWNFSDGTGSTDRNPSHIFNTPGTYNVFLTIIGPGGSTSTRREVTVLGPTQTPPPTLTATVVVPPTSTPLPTETATVAPTANFSAAAAGDLMVQFTDASTSGSGGITGWQWDFGDGGTSTEQNPLHSFTAGGDYNVSLTVTDAGGTNTASQTISVATPAQPPAANFSAAPAGDLTIQFMDSSVSNSGGITGWQWDFGDGNTSAEQNPQHVYGVSGDYNVSLTVSDAGGSNTASQPVSVAAVAQPPAANFSAAPAGDLTIQFMDASVSNSGGIMGWQWDFGDGNTSAEQNPQHIYGAPGDYNVSLTISDAGGNNTASQTVNVAAPAAPPAEPGLQETTPILPDLGENDLRNTVNAIFGNGQSLGNRASVFTVAGDETAQASAYLDPFNNLADYALDDSTSGLQGAIDFFKATDLGGVTSFNAASLATGNGWKAGDLLNPDRADSSRCNPGESPLACELRLSQPAVVIISVGLNDVTQGTDVNEFRSQIQQIVQTAANAGVIPVLTTIQPRPDQADRVRELNDAIIQVADEANIPLYNLWRALNGLPNSGLNGDNATLSQAPGVPGDITSGAVANGGVNTRNRDVLALLDDLRDEFLD